MSMWTSGAELSCSGAGMSFTGEEFFSGAGEDARTGEETGLIAGISRHVGEAGSEPPSSPCTTGSHVGM
jgi:hypothetical protein